MSLEILVKGIILGFSIAAPIGPIGLLCIKKTLSEGKLSGFVTGLGAATADAIYGTIAATGLTVLTTFLIDTKSILKVGGAVFLIYLSYKTFTEKPKKQALQTNKKGVLKSYLTTLFLTLTNPATILAFLGIFTTFGSVSSSSFVLVLGVFFGSLLWWTVLTLSTTILREKIITAKTRIINKVSGLALFAFAIWSLFG